MKLLHPKHFACRACRAFPLDTPCVRSGDPCHECPVCIRLRRCCFVHFYDEPRDVRKDQEGRKERPTRDQWCHRCKWFAPGEPCPAKCDSCASCTGTGIEREFCQAHCPFCGLSEVRGYCPTHYLPDPFEGDRRYLNEIRLGDPSPTMTLKTDRDLLFINGWWDGAAGTGSCKPDIVRLLIGRGRPSPVITLTDTQLLELKYVRSSDGSFTEVVSKPAALVVRVGMWGGKAHEALPGVVVEAVRLRAERLTLLVNEPITRWGRRHVAWSEALEELLEQRGARFTLHANTEKS